MKIPPFKSSFDSYHHYFLQSNRLFPVRRLYFFKDSYFYGIHIIRFFDTLFLFENNVLYFILIYYITQSTGCQFAAWCFFITLHKFPSFSTVSRQIGICAPDSLVFAHKYALREAVGWSQIPVIFYQKHFLLCCRKAKNPIERPYPSIQWDFL